MVMDAPRIRRWSAKPFNWRAEWGKHPLERYYGMTELVTHCIHSNPYETYPDMAMGKVSPASPSSIHTPGIVWTFSTALLLEVTPNTFDTPRR